jgi:hypothetical protein
MTENFDDHLDSLEDIVRRLTGMLVMQQATSERVETYIQEQRTMNQQAATFIE